jgi:hypothetical protein
MALDLLSLDRTTTSSHPFLFSSINDKSRTPEFSAFLDGHFGVGGQKTLAHDKG